MEDESLNLLEKPCNPILVTDLSLTDEPLVCPDCNPPHTHTQSWINFEQEILLIIPNKDGTLIVT